MHALYSIHLLHSGPASNKHLHHHHHHHFCTPCTPLDDIWKIQLPSGSSRRGSTSTRQLDCHPILPFWGARRGSSAHYWSYYLTLWVSRPVLDGVKVGFAVGPWAGSTSKRITDFESRRRSWLQGEDHPNSFSCWNGWIILFKIENWNTYTQ